MWRGHFFCTSPEWKRPLRIHSGGAHLCNGPLRVFMCKVKNCLYGVTLILQTHPRGLDGGVTRSLIFLKRTTWLLFKNHKPRASCRSELVFRVSAPFLFAAHMLVRVQKSTRLCVRVHMCSRGEIQIDSRFSWCNLCCEHVICSGIIHLSFESIFMSYYLHL